MTVDWGAVITQVLVIVLPLVVTFAMTWLLGAWAQLVASQKNNQVFQTLLSVAKQFVTAAFQLAKAQGWTNEQTKAYVLAQLETYAKTLHIPLTDEEICKLLDAVIEAAYADLKFDPYSPVGGNKWGEGDGTCCTPPAVETTPVELV